uniref:Uncharacterized protein n=1 Tax=Strongyloides venezuelensis TaxID=75913 RepID=A0A0K0F379_STRVS
MFFGNVFCKPYNLFNFIHIRGHFYCQIFLSTSAILLRNPNDIGGGGIVSKVHGKIEMIGSHFGQVTVQDPISLSILYEGYPLLRKNLEWNYFVGKCVLECI